MIFQPGEIIVFLVVMTFFFTFRLLDQKDRKIHKARKYIEKQSTYLKNSMDARKKALEEMQESIDAKEASTREMLKRVEALLEEIDAHGSDLMQMQTQLQHYHRVLNELAELTETAEQRLVTVKRESREASETEVRLEELRTALQRDIQQAETVKEQLEQLSDRTLTEFSSESTKITEGLKYSIRRQPEAEQAVPFTRDISRNQHDAANQQPEPDSWEGDGESADEPESLDYPASFDDFDLDSIDEQFSPREHARRQLDQEPGETEPAAGDDQEPVQPEMPLGTERKKDIVRTYRDRGFNASEIAEKMDITRGEVELLLEILRFAEDE